MRRLGVPLVAWVVLSAVTSGQGAAVDAGVADRFAGWHDIVEQGFVFDPDERSVLAFSLQSSPAARAAFDEVDALLDAGRSAEAARVLLDVMARHPAHAIQVADDPSRGGGRWVGAGEWALHQLLSRIPSWALSEVATPAERERLATARRWRDTDALRRLVWSLEGLPEGRRAGEDLTRLLDEQGRRSAARAAARRAVQLGSAGAVAELARAPQPSPEPTPPVPLRSGDVLGADWPVADRDYLGHPTTMSLLVERDRRRSHPFLRGSNTQEAPFAPVLPVVRDGIVYIADSISVTARDLYSGRRLWHHVGPIEQSEIDGPWSDVFDIGVYARSNRRRAISPFQVASPRLGEGALVATVQSGQTRHALDEFEGYPINHPLPARRMVCLDPDTGALRWEQQRPGLADDDFVNRFDVHGPVQIEGGVVYASGSVTEGAINVYVAAFDLDTGDLLWRTLLCTGQQELTMFNRPFQEHVISPPALLDDTVYVCTNLGVVGAVDAWSGRMRWVTSYEAMERRSSRMVRPTEARPVHWVNQAPFIEGDTLIVSPLDGEWLLGLEPGTGRRRWRLSTFGGPGRRPPLRHQAVPTGDGRVILVKENSTDCIDARSAAFQWRDAPFSPYEELSGATVLAGGVLYVPADPYLLLVDPADGDVRATLGLPETGGGLMVQRVVPEGAVHVMTDGASVFASIDREALRERHLAAAASDPGSDLVLAELALAEGDHEQAATRYARVIATGADDLVARARSGLVAAALTRAQRLDTGEAWEAVLAAAPGDDAFVALSGVVLPALLRLGDEPGLLRSLGGLAERSPSHIVSLGSDGPRSAALAFALRRLPTLAPEEQLAELRLIVSTNPSGRWEGLPVRENAARRIAALLETHGRALYAPYEAEAEALIAEGMGLEAVERAYPNAAAVARGRLTALAAMLAEGRYVEVFEQAGDGHGAALMALRAEAARALGESGFADALEGRPAAPAPPLPRLPGNLGDRLVIPLHEGRDVRFPVVTGVPAPEHEGVVIGCIDGVGEIACIDTRQGVVRWSGRALPGGARSVGSNASSVDMHMTGDLLIVRGRDTLTAFGLGDGDARWSRSLVGNVRELLPVAGLLVSLIESTSGDWRLEAHGQATGLLAFRIDLIDTADARMFEAGGQVVCELTGGYERGGQGLDRRLVVLDVRLGRVAQSWAMGPRQSVVSSCDEPPTLLLSESISGGSRVTGWSVESRRELWSLDVPASNPSHQSLFGTVPGRAMLREAAAAPGETRLDRDRLLPLDLVTGPQPVHRASPLLRVLDPPRRHAPPSELIVLIDPDDPRRLVVVSGVDGSPRYALDFDEPLPRSGTQVFPARDGFALLAKPYDPPGATLWVVRGEFGQQRYSVDLDDLRRDGIQVALVDQALVLASGGSVYLMRSDPK